MMEIESTPGRIMHHSLVPFVIILLALYPLHLFVSADGSGEGMTTREAGANYLDMEDVSSMFPSTVIRNGSYWDITATLTLSAAQPLYLGPGDVLRFSEGSYLNLSAPVLVNGTEGGYVELLPLVEGSFWGGLNLFESDPSSVSRISHLKVSGAVIGVSTSTSDISMDHSNITGCERSGIEIRGPLDEGTSVDITDTDISGCGYYGIHLQKVGSANVERTLISQCGTGMRGFASTIFIEGTSIRNSTSLGLSLVNSRATATDTELGPMTGALSIAQDQVLLVNSSLTLNSSHIRGGKVGISCMSGSFLNMDRSEITSAFTDLVQSSSSTIHASGMLLSGGGESAFHLVDSELHSSGSDLIGNGAGSGDVVFSSIYMESSHAFLEGGTVAGSGDAHFHLVDSRITISNATLGEQGNDALILDRGSAADYVNVETPSDVTFLDMISVVRHSITCEIRAVDYATGTPLQNVQIEVRNREGETVAMKQTGSSGGTGPVLLEMYTNTSVMTMSNLPLSVTAVRDPYEVSVGTIEKDLRELTMTLYPPNDPPELDLLLPVNGTEVSDHVSVQGYISDDLEVHKLRYRVDGGSYHMIDLEVVESNGFFAVDIPLGPLSRGEHSLWVHAFDGTHLSNPSMRTLVVSAPGLDDSDSDGIPDIIEDADMDGEVDANETDPNDPDTDDDGLLDGIEIDDTDGNVTDPLNEDTDGDFILDGIEDANKNGRRDGNETDPNLADTDGDGYSDLDDRYPLDPTRHADLEEGNSNALLVLLMVVVVGILIILLAYALYLRLGGGNGTSGGEEGHRERGRKAPEPRREGGTTIRTRRGEKAGGNEREGYERRRENRKGP